MNDTTMIVGLPAGFVSDANDLEPGVITTVRHMGRRRLAFQVCAPSGVYRSPLAILQSVLLAIFSHLFGTCGDQGVEISYAVAIELSPEQSQCTATAVVQQALSTSNSPLGVCSTKT